MSGPSPERIAAIRKAEATLRAYIDLGGYETVTAPDGLAAVAPIATGPIRAALDELLAALEAAEEKEGMVWHADDCEIHNANPPWRCTCDTIRLRAALEAERQRAERAEWNDWNGLREKAETLLAERDAERQRADEAPNFSAMTEAANWERRCEVAEAERDDARRQLAELQAWGQQIHAALDDQPLPEYPDEAPARIRDARRQLARAQAVLSWYADFDNWTQLASWGNRIHDDDSAAIHDGGQRARVALAELPETPPNARPRVSQTVTAYGAPSSAAEGGRRAVQEHGDDLERLAEYDAAASREPGERRQ